MTCVLSRYDPDWDERLTEIFATPPEFIPLDLTPMDLDGFEFAKENEKSENSYGNNNHKDFDFSFLDSNGNLDVNNMYGKIRADMLQNENFDIYNIHSLPPDYDENMDLDEVHSAMKKYSADLERETNELIKRGQRELSISNSMLDNMVEFGIGNTEEMKELDRIMLDMEKSRNEIEVCYNEQDKKLLHYVHSVKVPPFEASKECESDYSNCVSVELNEKEVEIERIPSKCINSSKACSDELRNKMISRGNNAKFLHCVNTFGQENILPDDW
eukprot:CAMPEP_0114425644 /NCGR_PEP_ID=MMETSP0103-20121206/7350_1 /TAXON_ID=37642 ORGANISM="Paraphysomonas imperforata, Strain PA2" /NCGR_SAMPLE_ID=MMETSP0103 /ASSEMBLY_ACC=CAM_ASM_000201 /LENGTH=271 /DNA_ID=CAMNT_0001594503 /DNA_START=124 /DNA_END=936 /DNA_ORIENTATION=+